MKFELSRVKVGKLKLYINSTIPSSLMFLFTITKINHSECSIASPSIGLQFSIIEPCNESFIKVSISPTGFLQFLFLCKHRY